MTFSLLYLALRALLGALVRSRRGLHVKDIELPVLRHELEVLRRQVAARSFVWLIKRCCRGRLAFPALLAWGAAGNAETLLRWHRAMVRWKWRQPAGRVGRPPLSAEIRELRERPHRALELQPPDPGPHREGVHGGSIQRRDKLGGLLHEYSRAAA